MADRAGRTALVLVAVLTMLAACGPSGTGDEPPADADATCRAMPEPGAVAVPSVTTAYPSVIMAFRARVERDERCIAGDGMAGVTTPQGGVLQVPAPGRSGAPLHLQVDVGTREQGLSLYVSEQDLGTRDSGAVVELYVDGVHYASDGQCRTTIIAMGAERVAGRFTCEDLPPSAEGGTFPGERTGTTEPAIGPTIVEAEGWFEATR